MKYVIKCDNGYYREEKIANRVEKSIETDINNSTVYELGDTPIEELEKDFFIQLLYDHTKKEGGVNPRLVAIRIQEI